MPAVVVDPARHVVERITQKMHVAALISRLRQNLAQNRPEAGVIVGDDKLDAMLRIPGEVARESAMMSPTIPI